METQKIDEQVERKIPCPNPMSEVFNANTPGIVNADFNAVQMANAQQALGYTVRNKGYMHTFAWTPKLKCCQVVSAVLKIEFKSLQNATQHGSNADNDYFHLMGNGGVAFPGYSSLIFTSPSSAGTVVTKSINITGAALAYLNVNKRISIYVQDDTSVLKAELHLVICCLDKF